MKKNIIKISITVASIAVLAVAFFATGVSTTEARTVRHYCDGIVREVNVNVQKPSLRIVNRNQYGLGGQAIASLANKPNGGTFVFYVNGKAVASSARGVVNYGTLYQKSTSGKNTVYVRYSLNGMKSKTSNSVVIYK